MRSIFFLFLLCGIFGLAANAADERKEPKPLGPMPKDRDLSGVYSIDGDKENVVSVAKRGDVYYLGWALPAQPVSYVGVGLVEGETISVGWTSSNGVTGVSVYRIEGDKFVGRWAARGIVQAVPETLEKLK